MTQMNKRGGRAGKGCCGGLGRFVPPRLFKALADPTRVGLLVHLAEGGRPLTVGELARAHPVDVSVVSRHLAVLREAGVIECTREGKEVRCRVRTSALVTALRDLADALEACCPAEAAEGTD